MAGCQPDEDGRLAVGVRDLILIVELHQRGFALALQTQQGFIENRAIEVAQLMAQFRQQDAAIEASARQPAVGASNPVAQYGKVRFRRRGIMAIRCRNRVPPILRPARSRRQDIRKRHVLGFDILLQSFLPGLQDRSG